MSEVQTKSSYYLPSGYDDNRIVLLTRDPKSLFAYWEISSNKKDDFVKNFGYDLWEKSLPVLKVTNVSKNISFYVRIDDFSNNWYINVPDPDCLYIAEIGRRVSEQFFINLASSNYISTPNNSVSSDTSTHFINYNDLRNGRFDFEDRKIYETYKLKLNSQIALGPSSPEIFRFGLEESLLGTSSAALFGVNLEEHLGVSSESFINNNMYYY
jgi:hypothetical protein